MVKDVGLFLLKVVQGTNGQDGEKKGGFGGFRSEGDWMKKGEMVMEEVEICGEVEVDGRQRRKDKIST